MLISMTTYSYEPYSPSSTRVRVDTVFIHSIHKSSLKQNQHFQSQ